jgi:hypothetical protein
MIKHIHALYVEDFVSDEIVNNWQTTGDAVTDKLASGTCLTEKWKRG